MVKVIRARPSAPGLARRSRGGAEPPAVGPIYKHRKTHLGVHISCFKMTCGKAMEGVMTNDQQKILPLNDDDQKRLIEQRTIIEKHLGNQESIEKYKKPAGKLGLLRALLETKVFKPDQTYELQCMGIVLGDVFVDNMGFRWVIVQDQYGRDPAININNPASYCIRLP
jgi:hypothetical protein